MGGKRIEVRKPTQEELDELGVMSWGTWGCEASTFPWEYAEPETCYLLEGRVRVEGRGGDADVEPAEFGAGDLVTFPAGLACTWIVSEPVRKHFRFG